MNLLPAQTMSGDNRIHVCKAETLLRALPSGSVDLIVTSPPYDNLRKYKGFSWNFEYIAQQSYRVLKQGGVLVWVVGDSVIDGSETLTAFEQALYFKNRAGFRMHDTMIWEKDGSPFPESNRYWQEFEYMFVLSKGSPKAKNLLKVPTKYHSNTKATYRNADGTLKENNYERGKSMRTMSNIWRVPCGYMKTTKDREAYEHPAMFPEELSRRHIVTWSNEDDTVLDFFMGSGTTAKMAALNNRRFIGCDISAEYVAIARERVRKAQTEARQLELIA